jgi:hypothetical protein
LLTLNIDKVIQLKYILYTKIGAFTAIKCTFDKEFHCQMAGDCKKLKVFDRVLIRTTEVYSSILKLSRWFRKAVANGGQ